MELATRQVGPNLVISFPGRVNLEGDSVAIDVTDTLLQVPVSFAGRVPDVLLLDADHDSEVVVGRLAEVKREYPEMPVVLFAGDADMPLVVDAMRAGAFDFIGKPL